MKFLFTLLTFFLQAEVCDSALHPVSITWVNADIRADRVILTIKTNAEDLLYFHELKPDSMFLLSTEALQKAAKNHESVILSGFQIRDQHKKPLSGQVVSSNLASLNQKDSYDVMELMRYPLYYKLEVKLEDETEALTFSTLLGTEGIPAVSFLSISKNGNQLVQNIELGSTQSFSMARDAVSIGSPEEVDFMVSYLTLSDTRIAHELTIPMRLLKSLVSVDTRDTEIASDQLREFIEENSSVNVDQKNIDPERVSLIFQNESDLPDDHSLVNVRVEYPLKDLPAHVAVSWESFSWKMLWFRSLIDVFGEQTEHIFSRYQPTFEAERTPQIDTEKN